MRALPIACEPGVFSSKAEFDAHLAEGRRFLGAAMERREPAPGALWLRITGPAGAKQVLDDAMGSLR